MSAKKEGPGSFELSGLLGFYQSYVPVSTKALQSFS